MLVPHIEHKNQTEFSCYNSDDLDSFFEYIDEVVLSHLDQTPDNEESDGQLLDEVAKEEFCEQYHLATPIQVHTSLPINTFKKSVCSEYKQRISLDIVAPPPDLI
jgi:hypothetical protein